MHIRLARPPQHTLTALAALTLLLLGTPGRASAEDPTKRWGPGIRMTEAVGRVMGSVLEINKRSTYGYDDNICIMAAFLSTGGKVSMRRQFEKAKKYAIIGGGDDQVEDLDIEILDKAGKVLAADKQVDASPVVLFTPPETGEYTVRQHLYKAKHSGFCVVAILRDGGWDVPVSNLTTAAGKLLAACNHVDSKTTKRVTFHDAANQWALYGAVLRKGEETSLNTLSLGIGQRVMLSAGDNNTSDIDLWVLDEDGDILFKDTDPDANPLISFAARRRPSHGLKFKNIAARGPSLILTAVLDID